MAVPASFSGREEERPWELFCRGLLFNYAARGSVLRNRRNVRVYGAEADLYTNETVVKHNEDTICIERLHVIGQI